MSQQIGFEDRVKYVLSSEEFGDLKIVEPIGWNEDEKELKRSDEFFGVFTNLSNNLKFVGNSYDYILGVYDVGGIEADVILTKYERNGYTDEWEISYKGYLDLTTLKREDNAISIKFNESGFYKMIQSRKDVQFEMQRPDTADGISLTDLRVDKVVLPNRDIQLFCSASKGTDRLATSFIIGTSPIYISPTTSNMVSSTPEFSTVDILKVDSEFDIFGLSSTPNFNAYNAFYVNANGAIDARFRFEMLGWISQDANSYSSGLRVSMEIQLIKFTDPIDYTQRVVLDSYLSWNTSTNRSKYVDISIPETNIVLADGEGLAIVVKIIKTYGGIMPLIELSTDFDKYNMWWIEDSSYETPPYLDYKVLLPHETAERLISIMTGRLTAFKSNFLGRTDIGYESDGDGALCGLISGFWARGFDTFTADKTYHLTTSFKDFFDSYMAVFNLGMGLEYARGSERVIIEELDYFFGQDITITIPNQVDNVKRTVASELHYASIEMGYDFKGDYQEAQGLDEYNIKNAYTTCITKTDKKYEKISKYRADSYGIEFARRKPAKLFGTEDTPYDKENFLINMKTSATDTYEVRRWQDDCDYIPTGVYSPDTAYNLKLTPLNNLLRHSWYIRTGLDKYLDKYVRYSSTEGNSSLVTKPIDRAFELIENGTIQNSILERSLINPIWIEFDAPLDRDLSNQVFGKTNGKQNYYGLVKFINELNQVEFGYLWDLKPNGNGQWKLLKANKITF